mgnify:CR=1 FL=1
MDNSKEISFENFKKKYQLPNVIEEQHFMDLNNNQIYKYNKKKNVFIPIKTNNHLSENISEKVVSIIHPKKSQSKNLSLEGIIDSKINIDKGLVLALIDKVNYLTQKVEKLEKDNVGNYIDKIIEDIKEEVKEELLKSFGKNTKKMNTSMPENIEEIISDFQNFLNENIPELNEKLEGKKLSEVREILNQFTGLNIPINSPIETSLPKYQEKIKHLLEKNNK